MSLAGSINCKRLIPFAANRSTHSFSTDRGVNWNEDMLRAIIDASGVFGTF